MINEEIDNLKEKNTYLIKNIKDNHLESITILFISKNAIKIQWNNDRNPHNTWELKTDLKERYYFVEDIMEKTF